MSRKSKRSKRTPVPPHWSENWFGNTATKVWGIIAVIAFAATFSRRASNSDLAVWVLLAVAAIGVIGFVNTHPRVRSSEYRRLLTGATILLVAVIGFPLGWWMTAALPAQSIPTRQETKQDMTEVVRKEIAPPYAAHFQRKD